MSPVPARARQPGSLEDTTYVPAKVVMVPMRSPQKESPNASAGGGFSIHHPRPSPPIPCPSLLPYNHSWATDVGTGSGQINFEKVALHGIG